VKGLILAGGNGTRLYPLTKAVSKQLLPVFDKPMVYYPLTTLMLSGIREIALISSPVQLPLFKSLLGDGSQFGINLSYLAQIEPRGIADAYLVAQDFLNGAKSAMVLGDNFFYGANMGRSLEQTMAFTEGARIFGAQVSDPENYGVLETTGSKVTAISEKPTNTISRLAIPGIYFLDGTASERAEKLMPSLRNELEITDLLSEYLAEGTLSFEVLPRGSVWLDMGTPQGLANAGDFVKIVQDRQSLLIAAPEEVALNMGFISRDQYQALSTSLPHGTYRDGLIGSLHDL
jgi:glucose-1-phosphate thymidylyltransferase